MTHKSWDQAYEVKHGTLRVKVIWPINDTRATVLHLFSNEVVCDIPVLLPANPDINLFTDYINAVDWDRLLTEHDDKMHVA